MLLLLLTLLLLMKKKEKERMMQSPWPRLRIGSASRPKELVCMNTLPRPLLWRREYQRQSSARRRSCRWARVCIERIHTFGVNRRQSRQGHDCRVGFGDHFGGEEKLSVGERRKDAFVGKERGGRGMLGARYACKDLGRGISVLDWECGRWECIKRGWLLLGWCILEEELWVWGCWGRRFLPLEIYWWMCIWGGVRGLNVRLGSVNRLGKSILGFWRWRKRSANGTKCVRVFGGQGLRYTSRLWFRAAQYYPWELRVDTTPEAFFGKKVFRLRELCAGMSPSLPTTMRRWIWVFPAG